MKKKAVLICFFILTLLLTSCQAKNETLFLSRSADNDGESVILTAKYHEGNRWYCLNSDESVVSVEVLTSPIADHVELGGVRQNCAMLVLSPLKAGISEVTLLYSQNDSEYSSDATLYKFSVTVDGNSNLNCTSVIPDPSIALGIATDDGSYWELSSCGDRIDIMDAAYIESTDSEVSNAATCYFPIIPLSKGVSRAYFVLKKADGSIAQRVTYAVTVNSDMSVSLRIP